MRRSRVLITGAAGGIGACVAMRFAARGAGLLLTDLRPDALARLESDLRRGGADVAALAVDVTTDGGRRALAAQARASDIDVLINVAGVNPFGMLVEQSPAEIERAMLINAVAPMLLCQTMIPVLAPRAEAHIVNIGSVFGSIGFPAFCAYSASKFALRGFSEALRRELADTSIRVHYVAPRATRTTLATDRIRAMNEELGVAMDPPEAVALAVERALRRTRREVYLGLAERIGVAVNAILPGIVDRSVRRQLSIVRRHATQEPDPTRYERERSSIHQQA